MTPNDIEILIHCHVSPTPHPREGDSAVRESLNNFVWHELIRIDINGIYRTTERGAAHLEQLCDMPLPRNAWVDASGRIIECGKFGKELPWTTTT